MTAPATDIQYSQDTDGIVTVTLDIQGQSANTMNRQFLAAITKTVDKLQSQADLTGVIFASAKKTFFAGGDLNDILAIEHANEQTFGYIESNKAPYRSLEKLQVPIVAAINGAALGGGYELCLACNHRILLNQPHAIVGLPEVTLGLLPGAGGVVRLTALLGLEKALPILLEGKPCRPPAALAKGMVDALVDSSDDLLARARAWILANPQSHTQPWDKKHFNYPNGNADATNVRMAATVTPTMLIKKTRGLMPAPEKILDVAVNSMRMNFDAALRTESRALTSLIVTPQAKSAIKTFFFAMNAIKGGKFRPAGQHWQVTESTIIGAGMMGTGIAWAHASNNLPCQLVDKALTTARAGLDWSEQHCDAQIARGRMSEEKKRRILEIIHPTTHLGNTAVAATDIIIEAVFEDLALKEKIIRDSFQHLTENGIYASNTSTLPISVLAEHCPDPTRFIGLHFFSPVDKMPLVEIIVGQKTSEQTLRQAYDYVQQIKKIPIVVNDSRGFFTSRVFGTYLDEGQALLIDGMPAAAIERAAWKVGMPVGPLAVHDEISMVLTQKVYDSHRDLDQRLGVNSGFGRHNNATHAVALTMVQMGRGGRHYGGGFYDYEASSKNKKLWPGLAQFATHEKNISMRDAEDRLIYRQVIEAIRCYDEGVLRSELEADIGSIMAIGFPAHTGGVLQYVHGIGIDRFAQRATQLEQSFGRRFHLSEQALNKLRDSGDSHTSNNHHIAHKAHAPAAI